LAYTAFLLGSSAVHADTALQAYLTRALAWMQNRDHNPAIAALIQVNGACQKLVAISLAPRERK
jgi:hypothetical protein